MNTWDLYVYALCLRCPEGLKNSVFLVLPGIQQYRLSNAPWRICGDGRIWVAGTDDDPKYSEGELKRIMKIDEREITEFKYQGHTENTREQMKWVVANLRENPEVNVLYISTAGYHLPRCILTFIRSWSLNGDDRKLSISAAPTVNIFNEKIDENIARRSTSVEEEIERIARYQKKGDVATVDEFKKFTGILEWNS